VIVAANWQRGVLRAMRVKNHPIEVVEVTDLTPWYRRVRVHAPGFLGALEPYPTMWVRLWVPSLKRDMLVQRGYTIVDPDPASGTFCLDFVLHEPEGAAARWARNAAVGTAAEVAYTPQRLVLDPSLSAIVLAGDATAVPAIESVLAALPDGAEPHVIIQDDHPDRLRLGGARPRSVTWVDTHPDGRGVVDAIAALGLGRSGTYVWAAGERRLVKAVREHARADLGLPREQQHTQYYWITGKDAG